MDRLEKETLAKILKLQQHSLQNMMKVLNSHGIVVNDYNGKEITRLINKLEGRSTWLG